MLTVKRERVEKACVTCRRRKIKCNGQQPCAHCALQKFECQYDKRIRKKTRTTPIDRIDDRLDALERIVSQIHGKVCAQPLDGAGSLGQPHIGPSTGSLDLQRSLASQRVPELLALDPPASGKPSPTVLPSPVSLTTLSRLLQYLAHRVVAHQLTAKACGDGTTLFETVLRDFDEPQEQLDISESVRYRGLHFGLGMILLEKSIRYLRSKLDPKDHHITNPMETLPYYFLIWKRAFERLWSEPTYYDKETVAKLQEGLFPDQEFMAEVVDVYEQTPCATFICDAAYVRSLFDNYYQRAKYLAAQGTLNPPKGPVPRKLNWSKLMIMNLTLIFSVVAVIDGQHFAQDEPNSFPRISSFEVRDLVMLQDHAFRNCLFYFHRISVVSEGLESIQALLLMVIHLETSWLFSDLNYSLVALVVRYAQDLGLHRLESLDHLPQKERERRALVWRACQVLDVEVCYRMGKPLLINVVDVSVDGLFSAQALADCPHLPLRVEFDRLSYIRCYTYMKLFSAQVKYDSLKEIQEIVSNINSDMFALASMFPVEKRPCLYNEPAFENIVLLLSSSLTKHTRQEIEMVFAFQLTYFNHIMIINKIPCMTTNLRDVSAQFQNSSFRKLSLDSARTILHIVRALAQMNSLFLLFNWLIDYTFSATTNLLSNVLNNGANSEVVKDLSLLVDVSMNVFSRISEKCEAKETKLFYIRVQMLDILVRVLVRVVFTVVDQTWSMNILESNGALKEHLESVEKQYPKFYQKLKNTDDVAQFVKSLCPTSYTPSAKESERPFDTNTLGYMGLFINLGMSPEPGSFSLGEDMDNSNAWPMPPMDDLPEMTQLEYSNLPNFFFDNGL